MAQSEKKQIIFEGYDSYQNIKNVINDAGARKVMIVRDRSYDKFVIPIKKYLQELPCEAVYFDEITPNPDLREVLGGVAIFAEEKCDFIISIGGGSVIDAAKCINILDHKEKSEPVLLENVQCTHLAVPTTAGSGSEATKFAVIYSEGEKKSIEHHELAPDYVVLDPGFLETLPLYQKKSTLLDALCQSIESLWAKSATDESRLYATEAKEIIINSTDTYLEGDKASARLMLKASNLSGRAINITKTTAAHAMSYKISTSYGLAHGHAVALCMPHVWEHYITNGDLSGNEQKRHEEDLHSFINFMERLDLPCKPEYNDSAHETGKRGKAEIEHLVDSVNTQRLGNHPILISKAELAEMYKNILK